MKSIILHLSLLNEVNSAISSASSAQVTKCLNFHSAQGLFKYLSASVPEVPKCHLYAQVPQVSASSA